MMRQSRARGSSSRLVAWSALGMAMYGALNASLKRPQGPAYLQLRVCQQCIERGTNGGYDAEPVMAAVADGAAEAGWPAPEVVQGGCTGRCEFGPNVRLCRPDGIPVVVDGMTEAEKKAKAFLTICEDADAQRCVGLAARSMKAAEEAEEES
eukprot:TRINITY_DN8271_c0_g1_i1.p2 TRINITY_DN8271_c0_g1~~TRINITY_DN8271_c0_g1_i1.p2  ORF type:complete len:152 (-),score=39.51 TRINITY_DN8271_c0_g1_i1:842-1297(-)